MGGSKRDKEDGGKDNELDFFHFEVQSLGFTAGLGGAA
jgi:hypothetical protein